MRIPRVYSAATLGVDAEIELDANTGRHLLRVLRMPAGSSLRIFDGNGGEFEAVTNNASQPLSVRLLRRVDAVAESPLHITLAQAVAKGERMDYALQKCVELGVSAIQPLFTERCVVRLDKARLTKRAAHWQGVIVAACAQSGRAHVPQLLPARHLGEWLRDAPLADAHGWLLDPRAQSSLAAVTVVRSRGVLLIGPEGGLHDAEIERAQAHGFSGMRLGPRVLRTETAATVALSILQSRFGDLG